ncbi:MAG: hypothetical protein H0Z38_05640 [Firmicutes bacterium]|nr:hypothetical protein [Bacillota bacterium]
MTNYLVLDWARHLPWGFLVFTSLGALVGMIAGKLTDSTPETAFRQRRPFSLCPGGGHNLDYNT